MWRRLKNLWHLSDIDPTKYSVGFMWTGSARKEVHKIPNPATIVQDNPVLHD